MKTYNKEIINKLLQKKETRIKLLEKDLFLFALYYFTSYFTHKASDFQKELCEDFMTDKNNLVIGYRGSAKTLYAIIYIIYCIAYKKKRFITFYTSEKSKSTARLYDIVIHLQTNQRLIEDFGELYPKEKNKNSDGKDEVQKKSVPEFVTTNKIRIKASSIGESPRGQVYIASDGVYRPDLVLGDDLDTDKTVYSIDTIEKNYQWIKGELMGGLQVNAKIIFLGNIIKNDGIIPRFEQDYKSNNNWITRRKALIENGKITWDYFTEDMIQKIREQLGEISFNQNYLLIPYSGGDSIIKRHNIIYRKYDTWDKIQIGVDPAISEKSFSDFFAITVTAFIGNHKNVKECYALQGVEKNPYNAVKIIKELYTKWKANIVNVETVAFQKVLASMLKTEEIAVNEVIPHKDKVTRLMEKQAEFEQGNISFDPDGHGTGELVEEILNFPNTIHEDRLDSLLISIQEKTKEFIFI